MEYIPFPFISPNGIHCMDTQTGRPCGGRLIDLNSKKVTNISLKITDDNILEILCNDCHKRICSLSDIPNIVKEMHWYKATQKSRCLDLKSILLTLLYETYSDHNYGHFEDEINKTFEPFIQDTSSEC